jgi:hypothetical protein
LRDLLISHPDENIETETLSLYDSIIDREINYINEVSKEVNSRMNPADDTRIVEFMIHQMEKPS